MKTRVGVIFGGRSGEHEISIRSASTVINEIDKHKYFVVPIGIGRDGSWLDRDDTLALLPANSRTAIEEQERSDETEETLAGRFGSIAVAFPVLHGTYGEDGTVQGLLEMENLPYVGCGVLASSCGMDKVTMKILFAEAGLPLCRYVWFLRSDWERSEEPVVTQVEKSIGYPCFVKPANLGSSVGVSRAVDAASLKKAIEHAAQFDRKIIVEEAIEMREIECAVIGNDRPEASVPGEYMIRDQQKSFLDYTEKYAATGNNEFVVPAPLSEELSQKVRETAISAFKAIDGSGLARVDFFLRKDTGTLLLNEINTMPGLTDASGFPKMWEASGKNFSVVIDSLIELARERHADRARNRTSFDT